MPGTHLATPPARPRAGVDLGRIGIPVERLPDETLLTSSPSSGLGSMPASTTPATAPCARG
jgi:hypothetical protein